MPLLHAMAGRRKAVLVDCALMGEPPGTIAALHARRRAQREAAAGLLPPRGRPAGRDRRRARHRRMPARSRRSSASSRRASRRARTSRPSSERAAAGRTPSRGRSRRTRGRPCMSSPSPSGMVRDWCRLASAAARPPAPPGASRASGSSWARLHQIVPENLRVRLSAADPRTPRRGLGARHRAGARVRPLPGLRLERARSSRPSSRAARADPGDLEVTGGQGAIPGQPGGGGRWRLGTSRSTAT